MAQFVLGMKAKAYIEGGSTGFDNMAEMSNVKNVALNLQAGEADVTTRANAGWRATAATLRECSAEFEMNWDPSDTVGFDKVKTAYLSSAPLEMAFLTGVKDTTPVAGSSGPYGTWTITNFSRNENLEEAVTVSVTAKLAEYRGWSDDGTDPS